MQKEEENCTSTWLIWGIKNISHDVPFEYIKKNE
jgi:hypothetical protein